MKITNDVLINEIKKCKDWITATELSRILNISTRTIRSKIVEINYNEEIIESSYKGYRYKFDAKQTNVAQNDIKQKQVMFILRKLIVPDAKLNIYDMADELYVSDTQFSRILEEVKSYLEPFEIELIRHRNLIFLDRNEKNIRRLIMSLITDQENRFLITEEIDNFISKEDLEILRNNIQTIFSENGIYVNDYGLQTILLHIVIMISRYNDKSINIDNPILNNEINKYYFAAMQIKSFIKGYFKIIFTDFDTTNLILIVTNNCNDIGSDNITDKSINSYLDEKYSKLTNIILDKLVDNYCLESFDKKFVVNLTIHIKNLVVRSRNNTFTQNPLAKKVKEQNALIYDMATFIANEIKKEENVDIVDDEIAFIAFHIGYYIETSINEKSKINCCFIYADYHMMYLKSIEKIKDELNNKINIVTIISIREINKIPNDTELIISCAGRIKNVNIPLIETNLFLSNVDISNIRSTVNDIIQKKKNAIVIDYLNNFFNENLFKQDFYAINEYEMIYKLSQECFNLHLVDSSFAQQVIDREKLSSTSFSNRVAIPHSLNINARKSFLYIVTNKKAMKWGNNDVNIILLIGASNKDKKAFKEVFSGIINALYDLKNVTRLVSCDDYSTFRNSLVEIITNYKE